ncbi:UNVERIFIED_CONTAM: hypothetical protein Slati_2141800 [Sesamum latifolium]|uniref:Uncharacterized protein n=1 Tax=Sesamum latifolium TaxID=2727402 RepID=A0AAW2WW71_9LAMI
MSSSDESVRFVGESNSGDDPSEATSRMAGSQSAGPSSGRRRSLRRMAAAFCRLIDEEEEEVEGDEGEASSPGEEEKKGYRVGACPPFFFSESGPIFPPDFSHHSDERRVFYP